MKIKLGRAHVVQAFEEYVKSVYESPNLTKIPMSETGLNVIYEDYSINCLWNAYGNGITYLNDIIKAEIENPDVKQ